MTEINLISKELMENLLELLSIESDEKVRRKYIRDYLEDKISGSSCVNDFKQGLEWMNVKEPLSFKSHLKGKIVILDFFTYCCINCMHILPDLKAIENQFKVEDGLVVIGVHSPKFSNEKQTANVAAAVERYEISHAVVNDSEETMWESLGIHCWPTLVVVGPSGEILLELLGEGHRAKLQSFIGEALVYFKSKGILSQSPLPQIQPFQHSLPSSTQPLSYPGKITVCKDLIAIADTGNHRIIITDLSGKIEHIIGGPDPGFHDGDFSEAKFHSLQGLTFRSPSVLFVADTENHAIREVNLTARKVKTLVGTGEQSYDRHGSKLWTEQSISSPWDVCLVKDNVLLIAMAGTHQIWALFLEDTMWWKKMNYTKGTCVAIAGSGKEENRNNRYPMSAAFAQPSGLCYSESNNSVFVADSESSTVRELHLSDGHVSAVVGGALDPRNLFGFGDINGIGMEAKLQHPLGVTWCENKKILFVADTYNHKIKMIDLERKMCNTFVNANNQPFKFNEPAGLCAADNKLFIADTNNHAIKVIDFETNIANEFILQSSSNNEENNKGFPVVCEKTIHVRPGGNLRVNANLTLSEGISLTNGAPSKWNLHIPKDFNWTVKPNISGDSFSTMQEWNIKVDKLEFQDEKSKIRIDTIVFYCVRDVCSSQKCSFNIHIVSTSDAPEIAHCMLNHTIS